MSNPTLTDIEERFVHRDMTGIDGKDVTYLLQRIAELEAMNESLDERYEAAQDRFKAVHNKSWAAKKRIEELEADLYEGNCELEKQQRINSELEAGWDKHVDMWKAERERNHDLQARLAQLEQALMKVRCNDVLCGERLCDQCDMIVKVLGDKYVN